MPRRNAYMEALMSDFHLARQAWWEAAEYETMLYATELAEYKADHPMPTLKAFMRARSEARRAAEAEEARQAAEAAERAAQWAADAEILAALEAQWEADETTAREESILARLEEAWTAEELAALAAMPASVAAAPAEAAQPSNHFTVELLGGRVTLRSNDLWSKTLATRKTTVSARAQRLWTLLRQPFPRALAPPHTHTHAHAPPPARAPAATPTPDHAHAPPGAQTRPQARARGARPRPKPGRSKTLATPPGRIPARVPQIKNSGMVDGNRFRARPGAMRVGKCPQLPRAGPEACTPRTRIAGDRSAIRPPGSGAARMETVGGSSQPCRTGRKKNFATR